MSKNKLLLFCGLVVIAFVVAYARSEQKAPQQNVTTILEPSHRRLVCIGRIEPVMGEVDLSAQMAGILEFVTVKEGDFVSAGTIVATVEAKREKALVNLAERKLARVLAGAGREEIEAAQLQSESLSAELCYANAELERAKVLRSNNVVSDDFLDSKKQYAEALEKRGKSLQKQYEAMKRGALPEEIAVSRAELELASATYDLRIIRAPFAGTITRLYRHSGDNVLLNFPTPVLQMVNTNEMQLRIEINENDIYQIRMGESGVFVALGATNAIGRFSVTTILPVFSSKRLFDPDTSARADTRTLHALCKLNDCALSVFAGQRVKVVFDQKMLRPLLDEAR